MLLQADSLIYDMGSSETGFAEASYSPTSPWGAGRSHVEWDNYTLQTGNPETVLNFKSCKVIMHVV